MNLLCPACHGALPTVAANPVVVCPACDAEVDVSRAGTQAGRPRFVPELDRTGTAIGGYRVEALIGGGGMGTVYRAVGPEGTPVALKVLSQALGATPAFVARFAREVEALARLDHPAIVRVLANGTEDGIPWFAMELVDGPDLKSRLGQGPLPPAEVSAIFVRLFDALDHAHARGVVHRDLKPANVLLAPAGAKLADFGIARFETGALTGSQAVTRLTETAVVIGSLPYMSPEQKRGAPVDGRSDLFSAGVMLYEAATGTVPQGAFSPPSQLDRRFGRAFDQLVMRLLHPDPARRPASAAEARRALAMLGGRPRLKTLATRTALAAGLSFAALVATLGGWTALRRGGTTIPDPGAAKAAPVTAKTEPVAAATSPSPAALASSRGEPVVPAVAVRQTPPNAQAIPRQSLDRGPARDVAPFALNDGAVGTKKSAVPKYRVDVKVSKGTVTSKRSTKARQLKVADPSMPDLDEPLLRRDRK